jgi:hypothetical protein
VTPAVAVLCEWIAEHPVLPIATQFLKNPCGMCRLGGSLGIGVSMVSTGANSLVGLRRSGVGRRRLGQAKRRPNISSAVPRMRWGFADARPNLRLPKPDCRPPRLTRTRAAATVPRKHGA